MNQEHRGIDLKMKEIAEKYGLTLQEANAAFYFFWDQVKRAKNTFVHPRIFVKGLGTFELIYNRIDYMRERTERIVNSIIVDEGQKEKAKQSLINLENSKKLLDEQYRIRKEARAARKRASDL
jgi:hypothetical protein